MAGAWVVWVYVVFAVHPGVCVYLRCMLGCMDGCMGVWAMPNGHVYV